jgi:hypothetical protein
MKKKKLSPKEAHARQCVFAHLIVQVIAATAHLWRRAVTADTSEGARQWVELADKYSDLVGQLITRNDDPARYLRLIVDALDGKHHGTKNDDAILLAHLEAVRTSDDPPRISELEEAFVNIAKLNWNENHRAWTKPSQRTLKRRYKALGGILSAKPGRHRKAAGKSGLRE